MLTDSTSAGRSDVEVWARSIASTRSTTSGVMPWPVRRIATSSSMSFSASSSSWGSPLRVTRLPRTWTWTPNCFSMMPRCSSPGPKSVTMSMLFGTTTVCRVAVIGVGVESVMDAR